MTRLPLAVLAAGLLAVPAPPASAEPVEPFCRWNAVSPDLPGSPEPHRWEVLAEGVAVVPGDTPTIRCVLFVDGVPTATTPTSPPTPHVAVTAGHLSYERRTDQVAQVCAVVTTRDGERTICPRTVGGPFPPDEWFELIEYVLATAEEAAQPACPALVALAPGGGPVHIDADGDVSVDGWRVYDCPPPGD